MLTDLQKRKLTRFFNVWDADGDGVITTKDPEQVAQNLAGLQGLKPGSLKHKVFYGGFMRYQKDFLKAMDLDENGRVTLDEWLAYHEEMLQDEKKFRRTALMAMESVFALMDRDAGRRLPALDFTPEQLSTWCKAERHLASGEWEAKCSIDGNKAAGVRRAVKLIRWVRQEARNVHAAAQNRAGISEPQFLTEYAVALLYHTLRTIGYESLSPFKRLLAIYSSARLIELLTDGSP